jgi:hypothetical protein
MKVVRSVETLLNKDPSDVAACSEDGSMTRGVDTDILIIT